MSSASARKELNDLAKIIRKNGFKVVPSGKGHYKIVHGKGSKQGQSVTDENGPVLLSSTPSDFRARDLAAARLVRADIIKTEQLPWKPMKPKEGLDEPREAEPDPQDDPRQRKRLADMEAARSRHERSQLIRAGVEPLIGRLGGWTKRGLISEIAQVLYWHSKDTPLALKSEAAAKAQVASLRKGGTLGDDVATAFEALLNTMTEADRMGKLVEGWMDMVRQARGLPARAQPVVAYSSGSIVEGERPGARKVYEGDLKSTKLIDGLHEQYGNGERYTVEDHPLFEMHRDGGLRWWVDITADEMNDLNRMLGFFEGVGIQLQVLDESASIDHYLEPLRRFVTRLTEARFKELAGRDKVAGAA